MIWSDITSGRIKLIDATSRSISATEFQDSPPPYRIEIIQYHSLVVFIKALKIYKPLKYIALMLIISVFARNLLIPLDDLNWTDTNQSIVT